MTAGASSQKYYDDFYACQGGQKIYVSDIDVAFGAASMLVK